MDGLTATKLIRGDPRLQNLPIIAMTAHALVEEQQRCIDAGMNDHVSKPIDPEALFTTLTRWAKARPSAPEMAPKQVQEKSDIAIPEIAGINSVDGLKRVAGNKRLYLDLLAQFADKQGDANAQIGTALQRGDRKLAERIAHTVKGVAANIGITEIQSAAARVEKAIREGDPEISEPLEQLASLLNSQVRSIRKALASHSSADGNDGKGSPFVAEQASAAVVRLKALLEENDGEAGEAFLGLRKAVGRHAEESLLEALGAAVNDFDFDTAMATLGQIAGQLKLDRGQAHS